MKKLLLETSFSKIYMVSVVIISLLIIGGYFSYAMFTVSKEKNNAVSIVTGNLTYKLEIDGQEGTTLTVPANSSKEFIVTLSNPNNRKARFNFYYEGNLPEGVDTGYIESDGYNATPKEIGVNLEKSETAGSNNTYIIRLDNITDEEVTINLGVEVGLDYNDLSLPENGHLFRKLKTTGPVKEVIEDDIMNRLNYEDDEQTFITGEDPRNYIWYSGKLWRAVSTDPSDNTVKLVTQWDISSLPYSNSNSSLSAAYETSYLKEWLNDTSVDGFLGNLRNPDDFIVTNSVWDATPTGNTLGDITRPNGTSTVTNAVGTLNTYEYQSSYHGTDYIKSYLNNGLFWTTLTPIGNSSTAWIVGTTGQLHSSLGLSTLNVSVRPSINLKSSVEIVDGKGTAEDPYRLEGDNDTNLSGTLLNTRYSGEYIRFGTGENSLYQIVSHENGSGTKITSASPLKENGTFKTTIFGNNTNYSTSTTIGSFLNNDYLNANNGYLSNEQINMIEDNTTWYLGTVSSNGEKNYKLAKYTDSNMSSTVSNTTTAKVGLLRLGELMAGQFERYQANDSSFPGLVNEYWLLTKYTNQWNNDWLWVPDKYGTLSFVPPSTIYGIKPALNLKSNVVITGGTGTKEDPFTIELQ